MASRFALVRHYAVVILLMLASGMMLPRSLPGQEEAADCPFEPRAARGEQAVNRARIRVEVRLEGENLDRLPLERAARESLIRGISVVSFTGQPAQIEMIREEIYPVEFDAEGRPVEFEVENIGFTLLAKHVQKNEGVDSRLEASLVELGDQKGKDVHSSFVKSIAKAHSIITPNDPERLKLRTKSGDLVTVVVSVSEVP